jgi:LysM repeat protein
MSDRTDQFVSHPAAGGLGVWGAMRPRGRRELVAIVVSAGLVVVGLVIALLSQSGPAPAAPVAPARAATTAPAAPAAPPSAAPAAPAPSAAPAAPPSAAPAAPPSAAPAAPAPVRTEGYQVRPGDTLATIALRHGVDYQRIAADNRLADPNVIRVGQRLRIGPPAPGVRVIQPGESLVGIASASGVSVAQLLAQNSWISNPDRIPAGAGLRVHP